MKLFMTSDETALNYASVGEGTPIVLLHTVYSDMSVFDGIVGKLAQRNQVILIDLRGHGSSDHLPDIDFEDYANDVKELLDYLYVKHALFLTHELGGSVALDMAARFPEYVDGLMLINPSKLKTLLPSDYLFQKYASQIRTRDDDDQERFLAKHLHFSPRKVRKQMKHYLDSEVLLTEFENQAVLRSFQIDITTTLPQVKAPTVVIVGSANERTSVVEAEEIVDALENAKLEVFDKSGLYPFAEQRETFYKSVTAFIKAYGRE